MWRRGESTSPAAIAIAHRAGAPLAPDDYAKALDALVKLGVEMVEFDVRRTADGVLVVHHDARASGMELSANTFEELAASGRRLITLDQFVKAAGGRLALDVELKEGGHEAQVLALVLAHSSARRVLVTSFRDEALTAVREAAPEVATGLLIGGWSNWHAPLAWLSDVFPFRRLDACQADVLVAGHRLLAWTGLARRARRRGVGVVAWTVNDRATYDSLRRTPGVLGVITDSERLMAG
jgi:glycerophosphoryl diester phosphodiesterase